MVERRTVVKARRLRRAMTLPEIALWDVLRARPAGIKFRRQHPIGPFVLDFYCASARLAIEVDGMAHEMGDNSARDARRDRWLAGQGVEVLRIAARDVLDDLEAVVVFVVQRCALPLHQPAAGPPPHAVHGED
ncbi:endonuclease domain-containing protein [Sphingomonas radiodurans]|uniref:endonuclease domain-containing protein n=1 Tax=Sphingomonas radiodurans TaxID=2890321 RepID=UPI001E4E9F45|nr:endonuclease domain-containing protein [Sphingomonas radiodurans]WBH17293.1 endonuclease domain-containing protein [Sphingomonas radiodurans]